MARILVADDEAGIREFMEDALAADGHDVETTADGEVGHEDVGDGDQRDEQAAAHLELPDRVIQGFASRIRPKGGSRRK